MSYIDWFDHTETGPLANSKFFLVKWTHNTEVCFVGKLPSAKFELSLLQNIPRNKLVYLLIILLILVHRRTNNLYLTCQVTIFPLHHGENKLHSMRWWWCPLSTTLTFLFFFSAISMQQQSVQTHYSDSETTSLVSYSLILHA